MLAGLAPAAWHRLLCNDKARWHHRFRDGAFKGYLWKQMEFERDCLRKHLGKWTVRLWFILSPSWPLWSWICIVKSGLESIRSVLELNAVAASVNSAWVSLSALAYDLSIFTDFFLVPNVNPCDQIKFKGIKRPETALMDLIKYVDGGIYIKYIYKRW